MVTLFSSATGWGTVERLLHWGMAAALLVQIILGWLAVNWRLSPTKLELFVWHKTLGICLLFLVMLRLLWRLLDGRPKPVPGPMWRQRLASGSHAMLYTLMLVTPVSGWLIQSASGFPFKLFGIIELPTIVQPSKSVQDWAELAHLGLFWVFAALLAIHVFAAFYHHFVRQDPVLRRMLIGTDKTRS
jgi:cytochrome b561